MHSTILARDDEGCARAPDIVAPETHRSCTSLLRLGPAPHDLREAFAILASMPDDFMRDGRHETFPQERDSC